jgi:ABC-type transport system involved in multi-copper enzyme maturation permease subunit
MRLVGPVFSLEWAANARQRRYVWLRLAYAGLVMVGLADVLARELAQSHGVLRADRIAGLADSFFWAFSLVQILTVLLFTPALTAGTVVGDARGGLIETLLVTDLSPSEIVLGKLGARLLFMLSILAAGLPMLALCLWLGGVSGENLLAVLGLTLVLLPAVGGVTIWVSIHSTRARDAMQVIYVAGIIVGLFPPLFAVSGIPWPGGPIGDALHLVDNCLIAPNPVFWLLRSWQTGSLDWQQWSMVIFVNGMVGLGFTALAVAQVRRVFRNALVRPGANGILQLQWTRSPVGNHPLLWKELFTERPARGLGRWVRLGMALIGWGAFIWMIWALWASSNLSSQRTPFRTFTTMVEPPLACIALLGLVIRAATCVAGERERGTWDNLLLTPQTASEIFFAKMAGCFFAVRWLVLLIVTLWTLGVIWGQLRPWAMALTAIVGLAVSLCAAATGVLVSLRCRSALRATIIATSISLFLSGGYLLVMLPFVASWLAGREPPAFLFAPCVPVLFVLSMVYGATEQTDPSLILTACTVGAAIYGLAGLVLVQVIWSRFDRWAGRAIPAISRSTPAAGPVSTALPRHSEPSPAAADRLE